MYDNFNRTSLEYKLWDKNSLPNFSPEYLARGLHSLLYWPSNNRYKVAGNFLSKNYQTISIVLRRWDTKGGVVCKPSTDIDIKLATTVVTLFISNKFMDFTDFSTPIKSYVDDRNYFFLNPLVSMSKQWRVYLQQNEAITNDDYLQIQSASRSDFFSIEKTIVDHLYDTNKIIDIYLMLGPYKNTYSRSVYTVMDLFGNVGGVYGLLMSIWGILVGVVSTQIMLASVFRRLYYTNKVNFENLLVNISERSNRVFDKHIEEDKEHDILNKNFELWNLIKYNTINHLFNFQICVLSLDAALFVLDLWCFFLSSVSVLWVATIFVNTVPSALSPLSTPQGATLRNPKKWFIFFYLF